VLEEDDPTPRSVGGERYARVERLSELRGLLEEADDAALVLTGLLAAGDGSRRRLEKAEKHLSRVVMGLLNFYTNFGWQTFAVASYVDAETGQLRKITHEPKKG